MRGALCDYSVTMPWCYITLSSDTKLLLPTVLIFSEKYSNIVLLGYHLSSKIVSIWQCEWSNQDEGQSKLTRAWYSWHIILVRLNGKVPQRGGVCIGNHLTMIFNNIIWTLFDPKLENLEVLLEGKRWKILNGERLWSLATTRALRCTKSQRQKNMKGEVI